MDDRITVQTFLAKRLLTYLKRKHNDVSFFQNINIIRIDIDIAGSKTAIIDIPAQEIESKDLRRYFELIYTAFKELTNQPLDRIQLFIK